MPLKSNLKTTYNDSRHSLEPVRRHLIQAGNVLVTINSAVNFIVYCMISHKFRELLVRHCCRCRPTSTASWSSVTRRHGSCCCWQARRWWRRQSETNDSKRSATASNNHSDPRSNLTPAQFTLRVAHQQQQQLMEVPQMMK